MADSRDRRGRTLCSTLEMVETFPDDCEGFHAVFGQVYEVKVRSVQKIVLKRPRAHPLWKLYIETDRIDGPIFFAFVEAITRGYA